MKRELNVNERAWNSSAKARREVFRWIAFYNHRRRHSASATSARSTTNTAFNPLP